MDERRGSVIFFLKKILREAVRRQGVSLIGLYVALLLLSSLLVMAAEPEIGDFGDALWWSVVTSTTVGYGDIYPQTTAGRLIAVVLPMFLGIGVGAAFITYLASTIIERRDRRMTGEKTYKEGGHIVVVGATAETDFLIEQIAKDDGNKDVDIVLVANLSQHPLPDMEQVVFIKGRPDSVSTLKKANIPEARRVVIHTGSDEESLFALVNVIKLKNDKCDVTVRCLSTEALETFRSVPGKFEVIVQMTAEMLVQAMQDKVHIPLQTLLTNDEKEEIYFVTVPEKSGGWPYWDLHNYLKEKYNYLTFALQNEQGKIVINPDKDLVVAEKFGIWMIAESRPVSVKWPPMPARS